MRVWGLLLTPPPPVGPDFVDMGNVYRLAIHDLPVTSRAQVTHCFAVLACALDPM